MEFRYATHGTWYRGNTHLHSTYSDGKYTFDELSTIYRAAGYDFLVKTDHWVASSTNGCHANGALLWLDGIELDGYDDAAGYYHVVALGAFTGITREMGFVPAMEAVRAQNGMLILAHPYWTGNSFDEALRWRFDGVEVYNHICHWLNGRGDGHVFWSKMLNMNGNTLAFASDDTHRPTEDPEWFGGWISVNAASRTPSALLDAIRAGNFYASTGPSFESLAFDGETLTATTSPVRFARLIGPGFRYQHLGGYGEDPITELKFALPAEWPYYYLEIEDICKRRAWTNTLFVG